MTSVVIQNTATDAGGTPLKGAWVRITLVASASGNAPGLTNGTSLGPPATVKTDSAGHWSIGLTPNTSLTPDGTWYIVDEGGYRSTIVVPPSGGPYSLEQVATDVVGPTGSTGKAYTDAAVAAESAARSAADASEASARAAGDTTTLSSAHSYTDSAVTAEASARAASDSATLATAEGYADAAVAAESAARASAVTAEAASRASGDAATFSSAAVYAAGVAAGLALTLGG